jgi:7-keto-8-aminopelargonate synthetase-like enzyme
VKVGSGTYLNFMSNDYLGLSQDPRLIKRAVEGVHRFGTGLGSARPQATSVRHEELEARLARWTGKEACAVFTTGYQSLVGTLQAFLGDDTTLVLDRLCHASIIDGMLIAQGQCPDLEVRFFKHNDVASLDKALEGATHEKRLIVVEGLYSVDGDMTPLSDVVAVARKHGAAIMLDDAHGLGTLGPTGRGVGELHGVLGEIDLLIGTFSKSFGTVGGFVCADRALVDYLKLSARSFVFLGVAAHRLRGGGAGRPGRHGGGPRPVSVGSPTTPPSSGKGSTTWGSTRTARRRTSRPSSSTTRS